MIRKYQTIQEYHRITVLGLGMGIALRTVFRTFPDFCDDKSVSQKCK